MPRIVSYTYDADEHCGSCAGEAFGWVCPTPNPETGFPAGTRGMRLCTDCPRLDEYGLPQDPAMLGLDSEGNPPHPVFSTDDGVAGATEYRYCGTCSMSLPYPYADRVDPGTDEDANCLCADCTAAAEYNGEDTATVGPEVDDCFDTRGPLAPHTHNVAPVTPVCTLPAGPADNAFDGQPVGEWSPGQWDQWTARMDAELMAAFHAGTLTPDMLPPLRNSRVTANDTI
jgi:hypothetical protein